MLYRSLLGKTLPGSKLGLLARPCSIVPHRSPLALDSIVSLQNGSVASSSMPGRALMAGSPLFVTDLSKPFDFSEIQFVLSEQVWSTFFSLCIVF